MFFDHIVHSFSEPVSGAVTQSGVWSVHGRQLFWAVAGDQLLLALVGSNARGLQFSTKSQILPTPGIRAVHLQGCEVVLPTADRILFLRLQFSEDTLSCSDTTEAPLDSVSHFVHLRGGDILIGTGGSVLRSYGGPGEYSLWAKPPQSSNIIALASTGSADGVTAGLYSEGEVILWSSGSGAKLASANLFRKLLPSSQLQIVENSSGLALYLLAVSTQAAELLVLKYTRQELILVHQSAVSDPSPQLVVTDNCALVVAADQLLQLRWSHTELVCTEHLFNKELVLGFCALPGADFGVVTSSTLHAVVYQHGQEQDLFSCDIWSATNCLAKQVLAAAAALASTQPHLNPAAALIDLAANDAVANTLVALVQQLCVDPPQALGRPAAYSLQSLQGRQTAALNLRGLCLALVAFDFCGGAASDDLRSAAGTSLPVLDRAVDAFHVVSLLQQHPLPPSMWPLTRDGCIIPAAAARLVFEFARGTAWPAFRGAVDTLLPHVPAIQHFQALRLLDPACPAPDRAAAQWVATQLMLVSGEVDTETAGILLESIDAQHTPPPNYLEALLGFVLAQQQGSEIRFVGCGDANVLVALAALQSYSCDWPKLQALLGVLVGQQEWDVAQQWVIAQETPELLLQGVGELIDLLLLSYGKDGGELLQSVEWHEELLPYIPVVLWKHAEQTDLQSLLPGLQRESSRGRWNYYRLLYAFLLRREDCQTAARVAHRWAQRLRSEEVFHQLKGAEQLCAWAAARECLLLCSAALALSPPPEDYFGLWSHTPTLLVDLPQAGSTELIVTLDMVRQELLRTSAEIALALPDHTGNLTSRSLSQLRALRVQDLLLLLAETDFLGLAIGLIGPFGLTGTPQVGHIVATISSSCMLAAEGEDSPRWEVLKDLLQQLRGDSVISKFDERALGAMWNAAPHLTPPHWLLEIVQRGNPSAYVSVCLTTAETAHPEARQRLLTEAHAFAASYLRQHFSKQQAIENTYKYPITAAQLDRLHCALSASGLGALARELSHAMAAA